MLDRSSNLLNSSKSCGAQNRSIDPLGSLVYKCETVITILTEIWLNISIPISLLKKKQSSQHLIPQFCPNVDHMRCVRVFIKHLHYFANSVLDKTHDIISMPAFENPDLDDVKKSVWTSKFEIQKKLYSLFGKGKL